LLTGCSTFCFMSDTRSTWLVGNIDSGVDVLSLPVCKASVNYLSWRRATRQHGRRPRENTKKIWGSTPFSLPVETALRSPLLENLLKLWNYWQQSSGVSRATIKQQLVCVCVLSLAHTVRCNTRLVPSVSWLFIPYSCDYPSDKYSPASTCQLPDCVFNLCVCIV